MSELDNKIAADEKPAMYKICYIHNYWAPSEIVLCPFCAQETRREVYAEQSKANTNVKE